MKDVSQPIFVLQGELDRQIPPDSLELIEDGGIRIISLDRIGNQASLGELLDVHVRLKVLKELLQRVRFLID